MTTEEIIESSIYFDKEFYEDTYTDVGESELSPIEHYMTIGAKQDYNPSEHFNAHFYQLANPEYLLSTPNPLKHYLLEGKSYGALICPVLLNTSLEKKANLNKGLLKRKSNTSLKIAFFSHNLNLEGAPLVCKDIAVAMQKNTDISITVFSPTDGFLKEQLEAVGIDVIIHKPFDKNHITSNQNFTDFISNFAATLEHYNFDALYGNTILSFWLIHVANQLQMPSVFHIHESEPLNYHIRNTSFDFVPLILEALDSAHRVVFVADNTFEKYKCYQKYNNFTVIKNAFSADEIPLIDQSRQQVRDDLGIEENEQMIVNIGTVANRKGQIDIINSLKLLDEATLGKIHFVIIGDVDTSYSQHLHKLIEEMPQDQASRIHFIKKTSRVFDYYNSADICLFTSRIESYPKAIQEAMHYALPIITTPVDGIVEQLQDRHSALFYQAGNAKELATRIMQLSDDENLQKKLGSNAYSALQTMISPTEMMIRYTELFQSSDS